MLDSGAWLNGDAHTLAVWTYVTTVNECLTMHFSKKLCIIGKNFI